MSRPAKKDLQALTTQPRDSSLVGSLPITDHLLKGDHLCKEVGINRKQTWWAIVWIPASSIYHTRDRELQSRIVRCCQTAIQIGAGSSSKSAAVLSTRCRNSLALCGEQVLAAQPCNCDWIAKVITGRRLVCPVFSERGNVFTDTANAAAVTFSCPIQAGNTCATAPRGATRCEEGGGLFFFPLMMAASQVPVLSASVDVLHCCCQAASERASLSLAVMASQRRLGHGGISQVT